LKTDRMLQTTTRASTPNSRKRSRKWVPVLVVVILALVAVSCGKRIPPYWPDLVVIDDTVYVAVGIGAVDGRVFALDAETGSIAWSYPVIEQRSGGLLSGCSASGPTDGPFFSAPAVSDEFIYLGSAGEQERSLFSKGENKSGLRVLNKLGTLQWSFKGSKDRSVTSPVLSQDTVYLASSDYSVYAVDIESRDARWVFETDNWVWASPLVVEDKVFVASMDHRLYAVDAQSGREIWRFDGAAGALPAAPAHADDTLYFGSLDGSVFAVDAQTGALVWDLEVDGGVWATPRIEGDALYFGTLGGVIYALNLADGTEIWQKQVDGEVRGTPAYASGMLYFGSETGKLYAFSAKDGAEGLSPLGEQLDAAIYTSPVFDGQRLYVVATDGQVLALNLDRGIVVWRRNPLARDEEK
jgi:outer membrane protein assembly factor BamB